MNKQIIAILQKAREILAAGWTQCENGFADANDVPILLPSDGADKEQCAKEVLQRPKPFRMCIVVAISAAASQLKLDVSFGGVIRATTAALRERGFNRSEITFNNTPGRTQEEVLALIDEAIAIAGR